MTPELPPGTDHVLADLEHVEHVFRVPRRVCARATMLLLISLRDNIFLYQGEELGLPQAMLAFAA